MSNRRFGQILQCAQHDVALLQVAHSQFANDQWMREHLPPLKQLLQCDVALAEVIDPNRSIDQDHFAVRRRVTGINSGSLPPRLASRRALSRSISAFNASRISADFSLMPVNEAAFAINASSSAIVVRMEVLHKKG